jgi:hypothetical protein
VINNKGFSQTPCIEFFETFALVAKFASIHTMPAITAMLDLKVHQMDVRSAFLNGKLSKTVFME